MLQFTRSKRRRQRQHGTVNTPATSQAVKIRSTLQAKLRVGSANDHLEREADATADRVMAMQPLQHASATECGPQRKCAECEEEELQGKLESDYPQRQLQRQEQEEEDLQTKRQSDVHEGQLQRQVEGEEEEEIQPKVRSGEGALQTDIAARIHQRQGRGLPLTIAERAFFEPRFGADFSRVRLHADAEANQLSNAINARAFTLGRDIYFNTGEFRSGDSSSRHLMAHELSHTLQQGAAQPQNIRRRIMPARVSCESYPRSYPIFGVIGTDDPTGALQNAVTRALALLDDAIGTLQYTRDQIVGGAPVGWPTVSDTVGISLRTRLLIDADNNAAWTGTSARTVHHAIRWYRNIRRVLASDTLSYTCIDSDCDPGDWAAAIAGESRIYLCRRWWHGSLDIQAITLIHEASHIYYDTEDSGRGMGNAYCLENFICDINDLGICEGC